jgi:demethylmenaquinone methyltransferase/2-methoxy-6-polyprenyl-1,4-benzoquinol methylase
MDVGTDLKNYYAQRAGEYERIYHKAERQEDIAALKAILQRRLAKHSVLEVACGTGFWTEAIARTARSILATDINEAVLEIARNKSYSEEKVEFLRADALTLEGISNQFTAAFAGFWLSHLPKSELKAFLHKLHRKLSPNGLVVLADNRYVEGSSTRVCRTDEAGNTYQFRQLADGTQYEVMKNFLAEDDFKTILPDIAKNIELTELTYFWCLSYKPIVF